MRSEIAAMTREEQALLNEVISAEFGLFFPDSKRQILQGRLEPRLRELRFKRYLDYCIKLQYDLAGERDSLVRLVTNNETYFFRERSQFESLFGTTLAELRSTAPNPTRLRFLSAGCSSGEEPYTLNIYIKQHRFQLGETQVSVEAFDIDSERVEMARAARYGSRSLRAMDEDGSQRYFRRDGKDGFALRDLFRDGVSFRLGNILSPASYLPTGSYDAIFCRNVLIYFAEEALRAAIDNFASALRPGGLLFLGHSESIIGMTSRLETVRLDSCLAYRKIGV